MEYLTIIFCHLKVNRIQSHREKNNVDKNDVEQTLM